MANSFFKLSVRRTSNCYHILLKKIENYKYQGYICNKFNYLRFHQNKNDFSNAFVV